MQPARAVVIGLLLGALPSLFIRSLIRVVDNHPRDLGHLTVVVVTSKALPAGHVVTMDDITQATIPDALATASLVKPDSASYVVNQKLLVPLAARDPLPWAAFETVGTIENQRPAQELVDACSAEMKQRKLADAPDSVAALRTVVEAP